MTAGNNKNNPYEISLAIKKVARLLQNKEKNKNRKKERKEGYKDMSSQNNDKSKSLSSKFSKEDKEIPWYKKPADRRTTTFQFRIYKDQAEFLIDKMGQDSSKLIRFLLDSYINKKTENTYEEFNKLI